MHKSIMGKKDDQGILLYSLVTENEDTDSLSYSLTAKTWKDHRCLTKIQDKTKKRLP